MKSPGTRAREYRDELSECQTELIGLRAQNRTLLKQSKRLRADLQRAEFYIATRQAQDERPEPEPASADAQPGPGAQQAGALFDQLDWSGRGQLDKRWLAELAGATAGPMLRGLEASPGTDLVSLEHWSDWTDRVARLKGDDVLEFVVGYIAERLAGSEFTAAAGRIQRLHRGRHGRQEAASLAEERAMAAAEADRRAAESAALVIQSGQRGRVARRERHRRLAALDAEREAVEAAVVAEREAVVAVQRTFRGHSARQTVAAKRSAIARAQHQRDAAEREAAEREAARERAAREAELSAQSSTNMTRATRTRLFLKGCLPPCVDSSASSKACSPTVVPAPGQPEGAIRYDFELSWRYELTSQWAHAEDQPVELSYQFYSGSPSLSPSLSPGELWTDQVTIQLPRHHAGWAGWQLEQYLRGSKLELWVSQAGLWLGSIQVSLAGLAGNGKSVSCVVADQIGGSLSCQISKTATPLARPDVCEPLERGEPLQSRDSNSAKAARLQAVRRKTLDRELSIGKQQAKQRLVAQMDACVPCVEHTVQLSNGRPYFLEFQVSNPLSTSCAFDVKISDPSVRVLDSPHEWQAFKAAAGLTTPVEPQLVLVGNQTKTARLFMDPAEAVQLPLLVSPDPVALPKQVKVELVTKQPKPGPKHTVATLHLDIQHAPPLVHSTKRVQLPTGRPWDTLLSFDSLAGPVGSVQFSPETSWPPECALSLEPADTGSTIVKLWNGSGSQDPVEHRGLLHLRDRAGQLLHTARLVLSCHPELHGTRVTGSERVAMLPLPPDCPMPALLSCHPPNLIRALDPAGGQLPLVLAGPIPPGGCQVSCAVRHPSRAEPFGRWLLRLDSPVPPPSQSFHLDVDVTAGAKRKISYKNRSMRPCQLLLGTDSPKLLGFARPYLYLGGLESGHIGLLLKPTDSAITSRDVQIHLKAADRPDRILDCLVLHVTYCMLNH